VMVSRPEYLDQAGRQAGCIHQGLVSQCSMLWRDHMLPTRGMYMIRLACGTMVQQCASLILTRVAPGPCRSST
jgi:hypothetical protein